MTTVAPGSRTVHAQDVPDGVQYSVNTSIYTIPYILYLFVITLLKVGVRKRKGLRKKLVSNTGDIFCAEHYSITY